MNVGQLRDILKDYSEETEVFTIDFEPIVLIEQDGELFVDSAMVYSNSINEEYI